MNARGSISAKTRKAIQTLSFVMGALIFLGALWILRREIAGHEWGEVLGAMQTLPTSQLLLCAGFTTASYAQLVCYDLLGLRYAKRRLPLPQVQLASFTAYVASHNLGLAGIGGTAVRARLYSTWGLTAVEIAQVIAFCTVSFWTGVLLLGGIAFSVAPLELSASLPPLVRTMRPVGALLLTGLAVYLFLVLGGRRTLRFRGWSFAAPSRRLVLGQILTAATDWMLSAAVVHSVLPAGNGVSYVTFLCVFLVAQLAGMLSHVPGGLGVFEGIVLLVLPGQLPPEAVLAGLLVYRTIYFLIPLVLGTVAFATFEALHRRIALERTGSRLRPVLAAVVPDFVAFTTFIGGILLLFNGALPAPGGRLQWLRGFLPLSVLEVSHLLASVLGAVLLVLAHGLHRRIDAAWWLSIGTLTAGAVLSLAGAFRYEESIPLIGMVVTTSTSTSSHSVRRRNDSASSGSPSIS